MSENTNANPEVLTDHTDIIFPPALNVSLPGVTLHLNRSEP